MNSKPSKDYLKMDMVYNQYHSQCHVEDAYEAARQILEMTIDGMQNSVPRQAKNNGPNSQQRLKNSVSVDVNF